MRAGQYNRTITFQSREVTQDPVYGTYEEGDWSDVATIMARVQDVLPGRGEKIADDINMSNRPARIWLHHRDGLHSGMRIILRGRGPDEADRTLNIISGPADVERSGFRREIQFLAQQLSTQGEAP